MPRLLKLLDGTSRQIPRPIETSPATRIVENYRDQKYLIFIDESFRSFFGLKYPNGYLCYAAVGIPESEYNLIKKPLAKVFDEYETLVVGSSGVSLKEFKHEDFRKLSLAERIPISTKLSKILKMHGVFIVGFFTHTRGVVMERVRVDAVGSLPELPVDHQALYSKAVDELNEELQGTGQSEAIAKILQISLASMAHFLEYFNCSFQILCDPREAKEDKAVQNAVDWFVRNALARVAPKEAALYLGMDNTRPSHTEVGLQLADLITGEVRSFFEENADLLVSGCTNKLITSSSREEMEWWETVQGIFFKQGAVANMPRQLHPAFETMQTTSCLYLYRYLLAAGILTCYTDFGNPRHIEFFEKYFFDQTD